MGNLHFQPKSQSESKSKSKQKPKTNLPFWNDIKQNYNFGMTIGKGSFGEVRLCKKKSDLSDVLFAVKSLYKPSIKEDQLKKLVNEIGLLRILDHPNIIRINEVFEDCSYIHIVMEYCNGGELFSQFFKKRSLLEEDICKIIWSILSGIAYCHSKGIVHRDIKPENILLDCDGNSEIDYKGLKIIDFGLSSKYENSKMTSFIGTSFYIAPEVIKGSYDYKCDVWSIGVIAYLLCTGTFPFFDENKEISTDKTYNPYDIYKNILNKDLSFTSEVWSDFSKEIIHFISLALDKNPSTRPSSYSLMSHDWFENQNLNSKSSLNTSTSQINRSRSLSYDKTLKNLRSFTHHSYIKKLVIKTIISNFLSYDEKNKMRIYFQELDLDHTGYINENELSDAYRKGNLNLTKEELNRIIFNCDDAKNGKLDYSEFLVGGFDIDLHVNKKLLEKVFKVFDTNCDGVVSISDMFDYLSRGRSGFFCISKKEVEKIIMEVSNGKMFLVIEDIFLIFGNDLRKEGC